MLLVFLRRLECLAGELAGLEKITLRASLAALLSFALALALGPRLIAWLAARFRETIRRDSPALFALHKDKRATPTMGGLFIVAGLAGATAVFGDLANPLVQTALLVTLGLAAVGAADDVSKWRGRGGLRARAKLAGQLAVGLAAAAALYRYLGGLEGGLDLHVPLLGTAGTLGFWFVPLAALVIVGASNAVNLADGLDGLAGGCLLFSLGAMTVVAYACGHAEIAAYLDLPKIAGAGELTVVAAGVIGAAMGFLWFNCHPAQVFMGDTGSLPLGGVLGFLAVATRQELLLAIVGGVFVAEAASVILQVGYYKWRKRRLFRCAPLHHHFQLAGWPEGRIVVRFWIASALCAILGLATLKLGTGLGGQASLSSSPLPQAGEGLGVRAVSRASDSEQLASHRPP